MADRECGGFGARAKVCDRSRRLPASGSPRRSIGCGASRVLSLASGCTGAPIRRRSRSCVAESGLHHSFRAAWPSCGTVLLAPARRSLRFRPGGHHMAHRILIPTPLRPFAGKQDVVEVEGTTVGDALQRLVGRYGDLRRHLYNEDGRLRSFVNIYVNDEDIRHLDREQTALSAGDTISIVPSVAGGSGPAVREAENLTRDEIQR